MDELDEELSEDLSQASRPPRLEFIYEDADLVVINKPAHLLSVPDRFGPGIFNLYNLLQDKYGEIYIVHRLDKDTSGVIIFAKNSESHRKLSTAFEDRKVTKRYWAIVLGAVGTEGEIDLPIGEDPHRPGKMCIDTENGKPSLTHYRLKESLGDYSLLELEPHSGRTHQIRVHLKAIGHPLLVDPLYGSRSELLLSSLKRKYKQKPEKAERPLIGRLTLHAAYLELDHPSSAARLSWEVPLPKDMRSTIKQLKNL